MFYVLMLLAAASRFLPHPPNVACLGAIGLFAGCYMSGRKAYLVPLFALSLSDVVGYLFSVPGMGFYHPITMLTVYLGVLAAVPVGRWVGRNSAIWRRPAGAVVTSTLFFLVSNFGVWLAGWYSMTLGGLIACYAAAIPFYGLTLTGDLVYTVVLFGAWELSGQKNRGVSASRELAAQPA